VAITRKQMNILKRTKELLDKGWIKHAAAKDANNTDVRPDSPRAVTFCATGALAAAAAEFDASPDYFFRRLDELVSEDSDTERGNIVDYNDNDASGPDDIKKYIDKLIEQEGEAA